MEPAQQLLTKDQMRTLSTEDGIEIALAKEFDDTYQRSVSGATFTYITGEQATTRLNEVLGLFNWSFRVIEHGYREDADEVWVMGELTLWNPLDRSITVNRQQFGSQKLKRRKSDQQVLDIGFDLKGAATDAFKKCATQVGVGLYLSRKETAARESSSDEQAAAPQLTIVAPLCTACNKPLNAIRFSDGTIWQAQELADRGKVKFGKVLCAAHFKAANDAAQAANAAEAKAVGMPPPAVGSTAAVEETIPF